VFFNTRLVPRQRATEHTRFDEKEMTLAVCRASAFMVILSGEIGAAAQGELARVITRPKFKYIHHATHLFRPGEPMGRVSWYTATLHGEPF
jgi:hypothetical protein